MNELAKIAPSNVEAYRLSTDAASICKEIVLRTSTTIQGRKYVAVEGWQAIATAHECSVGARDVEEIAGGVRAVGEVRRWSDGNVIATGEGFVGHDETTWYGGKDKRGKVHDKRLDYAIRAMAQTRAMSRACRSAFAHVVVMMNAGLQTTPAEEVPAGGFDDTPHNPQTGEIIDAPEKVVGISGIKKRLNAMMIAGNAVTDLDAMKALVKSNKDDIKAIREGSHQYWTGDGEDWEGFGAWIERRYAELAPQEDSLAYQLLVSTLAEVETKMALQEWLRKNGDQVEALDGEESRRFQSAYERHESAIHAMGLVGA